MIAETDTIKRFIQKQRELVQIERDEEETQLRQLLKESKVKDLARFGLCVTKLKIKKTKLGAFDKPVVVFCRKGLETSKQVEEFGNSEYAERSNFLENLRFSKGDLVALYPSEKGKEFFTETPLAIGSLEKIEDFKLTVVFNDANESDFDFFTEEAENGLYCLVQSLNDVTYRRYQECLNRLDFYRQQIGAPNHELIRAIFGLREPYDQKGKPLANIDCWFDQSLNEYQKLAVQRSISCDYFSLIHGPPGTGKTKTVCEVIQQLCNRKQKLLVTAASNIAVDNIIERLEMLKSTFKIIRIGNPTRTLE